MDLGLNRRRKQQKVIPDGLKELYPHDLNFFTVPPSSEISLSEFEDLAVERLNVLRILAFASQKPVKQFGTEWKNFVYEELQKQNLKKFLRIIKSSGSSNPSELDYQARRADHISHFILRLAYCRSEELRRWFKDRELELFKLRFLELRGASVQQFLEINNLHYYPINEDERDELREQLIDSTGGLFILDNTDFYKVPFSDVPNLVRNRKVFVQSGYAYIPSFELVTCISNIYRHTLSENLIYAFKRMPLLDDDRINHLLHNLNDAYTGKDYSEVNANKSEIQVGNLDKHAKDHYPLCMRHIHETLKANHHLKHGCRLQYLLFLKGIGLKYEDCMEFWRQEFTKNIDEDKFQKQYSYLVKHCYGKVGSMLNYSPYSCVKIITDSVGYGEQHGCPYKQWESTVLKEKLESYGLRQENAIEISEMAQKGHYQLACGKYFEYTRFKENKNVINHPNQYFDESYGAIKREEFE
ncbi:PREDICTED: DNA primase large subunit [Nicrophorus vespilloides]|uniref:DNA primase large subunit n=1 Tax=Nicrophorus vespilloides TaxID=110193 RepID=A0ABM1N847_NICVS|nr:PREDICTED: DNA primase large subunit [Nicrophorus vespilloides]